MYQQDCCEGFFDYVLFVVELNFFTFNPIHFNCVRCPFGASWLNCAKCFVRCFQLILVRKIRAAVVVHSGKKPAVTKLTKHGSIPTFMGRLHGEFQPRLKFCCDYMVNFSRGKMLEIGLVKFTGKRFTFTAQAVRMPKFIFRNLNYMRFLSPFDRA